MNSQRHKHHNARYLNRELAVLAFNQRVLALAQDPHLPLLERLRYLCIVSNNLDEFFEIRVAGLLERVRQNPKHKDKEGQVVQDTLHTVFAQTKSMVAHQYHVLNDAVLPALRNQGVVLLTTSTWSPAQVKWVAEYFQREILPVLTPIGLDPAHPFPRVLNKSLNFVVDLSGHDAFGRTAHMAIVQAPRALPRLIRVPEELADQPYAFVMLSSMMQAHIPELFLGMQVHGVYPFRVTRNSDLYVDEEEITNLRVALQGELSQRHFGDAVRLEITDQCPPELTGRLLKELGLGEEGLFRVNGPVNLVRLMQLPEWVDRPDLKYPCFIPGRPAAFKRASDMFAAIRKGDVLLHHPYQDFTPVLDFVHQAATDPEVLAIKQTIYRTGVESVLMESLVQAAKSGKEVTVVLELMARFDEEANIQWAAKLERVGAHVVYGVVGQKTHAKMLMVVRREHNKHGQVLLRRYVHLGTGNYHPKTARLYTDFGLFSCHESLGQDVHDIFNQLTGLGQMPALRVIWNSPFVLHSQLLQAIAQETHNARAGHKARIVARMNALLETQIIDALYAASQAGVEIDLIVRGVCALRPGVVGLSDNIRVRSVVGRFLEHSRVFYFYHQGAEHVYISSADWMERNFFRRVELAVPILDKRLKKRVIEEGLFMLLNDNVLAWAMNSEGQYQRCQPVVKADTAVESNAAAAPPGLVDNPVAYNAHAQLLHVLASSYNAALGGAMPK